MKINKYNIGKEGTTDSRQVQSGLLVGGISNQGVEVTEEAQRLKETHLIFGQPFNGSQDVSGDISNAQNISASGGDLTLKKDVDAEGEIGGNIYADGNISAGGNVSGVKLQVMWKLIMLPLLHLMLLQLLYLNCWVIHLIFLLVNLIQLI